MSNRLPSGQSSDKPHASESRTLIDELLAEQRELTAVETFSPAPHPPAIAPPHYLDLLPFTAPAPRPQNTFEVDLDKCSGRRACVPACHSLTGLDGDEPGRSVAHLASPDWRAPLKQTVPTACHHCVDPACLNGCPVLAYDKDPVTGIVRHLDDQCIGCQYCIMKCPYDVPKYSPKRGIVRKCDMCANRLAAGEAPACVQACPSEAIRIVVSDNVEITESAQRGDFLAAAPSPTYTLPTTRYKSRKPLPDSLLAGDYAHVKPSEAHLPL